MLTDLVERYDAVLDAVEATDGWATSVRASRPPLTIMGSLGGVEAGLRQMRRRRALHGDDPAAARLFGLAVARARSDAEAAEREEVAARVLSAIAASGLPASAFAVEIGTSASRLSTYASGRVTPSAVMLLRIERVAAGG